MIRGQIVFGSVVKGESFSLTPDINAVLVRYSDGVAAIVDVRIGDREIAINEYDKKRGFSNTIVYDGRKWRITGYDSTTGPNRILHFEVVSDATLNGTKWSDESSTDAPIDYPYVELD